MAALTWQDDFALWTKGMIDAHEIERRLEAHGWPEDDILDLIPDLVLMKRLFPPSGETGKA